MPAHNPLRAPYSKGLLVAYLVSAVLVTLLIIIAVGRVPPLLLGAGLVLYLVVMGLLLWRYHPARGVRRLRDVVPCYLSVQDRELRIIETNERFRADFGEGVGEFCYRAYKQRETPCPDCPVLKTFADGRSHSGEEVVVTRDGKKANMMITSTPIRDAQGRTEAVLETSSNITELKELQHQLDRSKQYFQQLFDIVPCYISIQNRDYEILESNELFKKDFGVREGDRCYHAYKGRDSVCPDCLVEKTFEDGQVHSSEEIVVTQDGRRANMIVYSMPVRDENGAITSVMEVSTNVTELKKLQHQLAMMGMAVAGMAHRIKNILMGLEGGIFVVNTGFETDEKRTIDEGWEMVERNVAKISRLVKDLLYCSKERKPAFKEGTSPQKIVQEVHEIYEKRAEKDAIELHLELGGVSQPGAFDGEGIHNLMMNLVANAIDACRFDPEPKRHRISVSCKQDGSGTAVIEVSDNGAGIPADLYHKVFKGFFSTKGTEGTGLGLLVVQKVVEEHGGTISFSSKPGEGTTFTVVLPPETARVTQPGSSAEASPTL